MNSDFKDAHERHWEDAELLYGNQRWANADHLYGMAVECGLKHLMIAFGMPIGRTGNPSRQDDWVHANGIWARYEAYRSGHPQGTRFALPPGGNPFSNWTASQRYAHRSNFNRARVNQHRQGAQQVRALLQRAVLEGLIKVEGLI